MIERRHLFCGALVFSVAACSGAQQAVKWTPVPSAPAARWATCTLVNGDEALARQLGKLGWKSTGKDFPNISWSEDIAAVVSTVNPRLEPVSIFQESTAIFVRLSPGTAAPAASVLVLLLDRVKYRTATTCELPVAAENGASIKSQYKADVE